MFEWGKQAYGAGENGGITGVVYNQVTRAENDPRFAAAETWETGIPRVQVNLYRANADGVIQDTNGIPASSSPTSTTIRSAGAMAVPRVRKTRSAVDGRLRGCVRLR